MTIDILNVTIKIVLKQFLKRGKMFAIDKNKVNIFRKLPDRIRAEYEKDPKAFVTKRVVLMNQAMKRMLGRRRVPKTDCLMRL